MRPGEVAMEASIPGQYSLVRFVAPVAGTYKVSAQFEGIHYGLSTTDVHVLHNATSLFNAPISMAMAATQPSTRWKGQARQRATQDRSN